ncbi:MAG: class I SAM-dependent methyltransferase [Caldilineaceae bacterium]
MSKIDLVCRSCSKRRLAPILMLGNLPLANALLTKEQLVKPEARYPLNLVLCSSCGLVQITETVPAEELFSTYPYFSSFSDTVIENAKNISRRLIAERRLNDSHLVIEIASNDGYLLKHYQRSGIPVLGIEPAQNIASVAQELGIPTLNRFFNEKVAKKLARQGKQADVFHANNVVAHVADLHGVVAGICELLKTDGVAVIENHYIKSLIDKVEFDSIYHEHLCYFSATSFADLFAQHGLTLADVELLPIHGGSIRAFFQRTDGKCSLLAEGRERVNRLLAEEAEWGVKDLSFYANFGQRVDELRRNLLDMLGRIKADGGQIAVYGASAKSTTLLNTFQIGSETLDYVIDRSTAKQGLYTPGTHLPIYGPERLLESPPDYLLLLAWNFADEILEQQKEYRRQGGRFIVPIPELRIV